MTLYLIPSPIGVGSADRFIPEYNLGIMKGIKIFVVEDERTARRFLKKAIPEISLGEIELHVLNEHTPQEEFFQLISLMQGEHDIGLMSEAGCPAIADPGSDLVQVAHEKGIRVVPLVGPSSLIMALMASGMNGQQFSFHGYLPREKSDRIAKIQELEHGSRKFHQAQLFIEAPYRNQHVLEDILKVCDPETRLCIAVDIGDDTEMICTKRVSEWKKQLPDIQKRPAVFILQVNKKA